VTPRRLLAAGTLVTALGLGLAAMAPVLGAPGSERTRPQELAGGVFLVAGWALLACGIHLFGRTPPAGG
jgi:hypothetical protein